MDNEGGVEVAQTTEHLLHDALHLKVKIDLDALHLQVKIYLDALDLQLLFEN